MEIWPAEPPADPTAILTAMPIEDILVVIVKQPVAEMPMPVKAVLQEEWEPPAQAVITVLAIKEVPLRQEKDPLEPEAAQRL